MYFLKKTIKCQGCIDRNCGCAAPGTMIKSYGPYRDINNAYRDMESVVKKYAADVDGCACQCEVIEV